MTIPAEKQPAAWLDELNPQQLEAVTHGAGPLLVVAGAGSGKTKTLAYRVAYLISTGVSPESILLLTFTRRAAREMLRRAAAATESGEAATGRVWGGTFHAFANRILRIYSGGIGLSPDFTVMDRTDAEDLLDVVRNDMGFSKKGSRFPRKGTCMSIYSSRVNGNLDLDDILKRDFPWCQTWQDELKGLFRAYVERKQKQSILDYDDLLLYLYHLLQNGDLARDIGGRFEHVLVDEYQDTNPIQAGILMGLRRENGNIMVVGDDAQAIYSFRSASVRNILDFPQQFPGTTVVTLEQNYRSVQPILETTNRVIAQAKERFTKELWSSRKSEQRPQLITCADERQQDDEVVRLVLEHYEQGVPLRRQAVLFRAAHHANSLELALTRRNIPYHKYGGLRFLEAAHIKDLVSFLRVLQNPRDEVAWFRVLQLLEGVGPATAAAAVEHIGSHGGRAGDLASYEAPAGARPEMAALAELLGELQGLGDSDPGTQVERVRQFYQPILVRSYENPQARQNDLEYLGSLAAGYASREQFLADLILDPPSATSDLAGSPLKEEDWLVLSTIHSAKGLEWDVVYLIHASDGCIPSDMATGDVSQTEEELRVAYVGMTRAKDFLYVLWPQRYYNRAFGMSDRHSYAQCSRFFTPAVLQTMERVTPRRAAEPSGGPAAPSVAEDIAGRIRDLWS